MLHRIDTPIDQRTPEICRFDAGVMHEDIRPLALMLQRHNHVLQAENRQPCRCSIIEVFDVRDAGAQAPSPVIDPDAENRKKKNAAPAGGETQRTIAAWAGETFGDAGSLVRIATRADEEHAELQRAIAAKKPRDVIVEEIADVVIVLCRLGHKLGPTTSHFDRRYFFRDDLVAEASAVYFPYDALFSMSVVGRTLLGKLLDCLHYEAAYTVTALCLHHAMETYYTMAGLCGVKLIDAVDRKMAINRQREWTQDGTGHGYHLRDKAAQAE